MTSPAEILLILACLAGTALFAGLETGVISINRLRLEHWVRRGRPGARILQDFLAHPDHLLGTTLVGTNICMVTASVTAASLFGRLLGPWGGGVSSVVMTLVILIGCEYLPKAWFQGRPVTRTRPFAPFLKFAGLVLYPISKLIMLLARLLVPTPSAARGHRAPFISKEELKLLTREGEQSGELTPHERKMIHAVLDLAHKTCREIMLPARRIIKVLDDAAREDILSVARAHGHIRLPVYVADEGRYVGIVHVFDLLRDTNPAGKRARDYMRPPQFISADTPADELLPRMRLTRQPMALVTDAHSQVIGLVTSEMLLQQIVAP